MGTDLSFGTAIGYDFTLAEINKAFGVKALEESHMEKRFDKKSGKKIAPEKVIDHPARLVYKFDDETIEAEDPDYGSDHEGLCDKIALHLKCEWCHSYYYGEEEATRIYFMPKMPKPLDDGACFGHIDTDGPLPFDAVVKMAPKMKKLAAGLKKLGLKPGKAGIHVTYSVQ